MYVPGSGSKKSRSECCKIRYLALHWTHHVCNYTRPRGGCGFCPVGVSLERVISVFSAPETVDSDQGTENELQLVFGLENKRTSA